MTQASPEFSRPIPLADFANAPVRVTVRADERERAALAERLGLAALSELSGEAALLRVGEGARLTATWRARVTQSCVVTLEPVDSALEDYFAIDFAPQSEIDASRDVDVEVDPEEDAPDPMPESAIDVGEYLAEQLALSLDPYPRKPGASAEAYVEDGPEKVSPFAELARLRGRGGGDE